jgi:RNA polymerase sigma factor (sigma-70 family)
MVNEHLVLSYLSLADALAWKKKRILASISFDELQAAAYFGLCTAAKKYNPKISQFPFYAKIKIEGAIIDFIREIRGRTHRTLSLDTETPDGQSLKDNLYQRREITEILAEITENLSEDYKKIVFMYYLEGLSLKEISVKLGVVESRVCQILNKCRKQMREDHAQMAI